MFREQDLPSVAVGDEEFRSESCRIPLAGPIAGDVELNLAKFISQFLIDEVNCAWDRASKGIYALELPVWPLAT